MKDENIKTLKEFIIDIDYNKKLKKCSKCKYIYPAEAKFFYKHRNRKDGLDNWCKECKKEYDKTRHKFRMFNISLKQNMSMLKEQNN